MEQQPKNMLAAKVCLLSFPQAVTKANISSKRYLAGIFPHPTCLIQGRVDTIDDLPPTQEGPLHEPL